MKAKIWIVLLILFAVGISIPIADKSLTGWMAILSYIVTPILIVMVVPGLVLPIAIICEDSINPLLKFCFSGATFMTTMFFVTLVACVSNEYFHFWINFREIHDIELSRMLRHENQQLLLRIGTITHAVLLIIGVTIYKVKKSRS